MSRRKWTEAFRLNKPQRALLRGVTLFLFFLALDIFFENRDQIEIGDSSCDVVHADTTPPFYERVYPSLARYVLGRSTSGQVRILFIPKDLAVVQQDLCAGRSYLADLVQTLAESKQQDAPSAIVIDKYFSKSTCTTPGGEEGATTKSLRAAITSAIEKRIPVIVGSSTKPSRLKTDDHSCLVQNTDQLTFAPAEKYFAVGLLKMNANREQIPLKWRVLSQQPESTDLAGEPKDSLALAAATMIAPKMVESASFKATLQGARQPYARLDIKIPQASTQNFLCATSNSKLLTSWDCPSFSSGRRMPVLDQDGEPFEWSKKVVIIGSQNEVDHWPVLGERQWGYELQADYLDALLSGKYVRAASGKLIFILSVIFVFLLEAVPALGDYLYCEKNRAIPKALRNEETWIWIYPPAFCLLTLVLFRSLHCFPPLSLIFAALLTMIARLLFAGMGHYKKLTVPHKEELEP